MDITGCSMESIGFKQEIISLCNDMITFWDRLQKEVKEIPEQNQDELILKWKNYFSEHSDIIVNLSTVKRHCSDLEEKLIVCGTLKYTN